MKIWKEEIIEEEIKNVMVKLGIDRMPTASEINLIQNNTCLTNAIRRNNGFLFWAKKLKLNQSKCETRFGLEGELFIKKYLEEKAFTVNKMSVKHPYDLLVNHNIKIDVKTANIRKTLDGDKVYSFNLEKKNPTCDIYIFLCIDNEIVKKMLIIPSIFLHQTQLCIGEKSKYDIYKDKWRYISKYDEFYKNID